VEDVISIVAGFVLTTIAGGWWASRLQQRSWNRQNELRLVEDGLSRAAAVCDELSRLLDKRLYRMRRLFWAVAAVQRGDPATERLDSSLQEYDEVLYEWNDRLNANLALLGTHFGTAARQYLFDLYEDFRRVGRELEAAVTSVRAGQDVSAALARLDTEFEGWSPGSLNNLVYTLSVAMTTQLRDGSVSRSAPEGASSPALTVRARTGDDASQTMTSKAEGVPPSRN
jgi:hypothetical protein